MTAFRSGAAAVALLLAGCAGAGRMRRDSLPPPAQENRAGAPARSAGPDSGARVQARKAPAPAANLPRKAAAATALVGRRTVVVDGVDYGSDCAALVRAAFDRAGRPLPPTARDAAGLYALAVRRGAIERTRRPGAADVVFLADRPGGAATHVG